MAEAAFDEEIEGRWWSKQASHVGEFTGAEIKRPPKPF
jgi:hypothetical protein